MFNKRINMTGVDRFYHGEDVEQPQANGGSPGIFSLEIFDKYYLQKFVCGRPKHLTNFGNFGQISRYVWLKYWNSQQHYDLWTVSILLFHLWTVQKPFPIIVCKLLKALQRVSDFTFIKGLFDFYFHGCNHRDSCYF